ncbi:MAG: ArsR/SmtB family transcription factor [Candidatus Woesearchaeota archaeon]
MVRINHKITLINARKPPNFDINEELRWIGASLGLFNMRDKDQSCFRVFIEMIKNARSEDGISSDELAYRLELSRGTVVHHLNKLIQSGIVIVEKNKYHLRVDSLDALISEIEKDLERTIQDMKEVASEVDTYLGFKK